ncbi:MAG: hypothetical protein ACRC6O_13250 [Flavobacterium sp.]
MSDISNIFIGFGVIVLFLVYVKSAIKFTAKEELSNIRKDFTVALDNAVASLTNEIKRIDAHCTGTVNDNAKNICVIVKNSIEEYFENKK